MSDGVELHQALEQQQVRADRLLDVLDRETGLIMKGEVDELAQLIKLKQQRCSDMEELGQLLQGWLAGLSLERWLARQDGEARAQWQRLEERLRECQRKNDANGLLIGRRQAEIEQKLKPLDTSTYAASGRNEALSDATLGYRA